MTNPTLVCQPNLLLVAIVQERLRWLNRKSANAGDWRDFVAAGHLAFADPPEPKRKG
jgi:hypothetical protein